MEEKSLGAVQYKDVDTPWRLSLGVLGKSMSSRLQGIGKICHRKNRSVSESLL